MVEISGAEQYIIGGIAASRQTPIENVELGSMMDVPMGDLGDVLLDLEEKGIVEIDDEHKIKLTGKSLGECALCKHEIEGEPYDLLLHRPDVVQHQDRYLLHERCAEVLTFMLEH